jgi:hypothetical protein
MTELSLTLPAGSGLGPVDYGSSRVAAIAPLHELDWTVTRITTIATTGYSGWMTDFGWFRGRYYSGGDPAIKDPTRAECVLTRDGIPVGKVRAKEPGILGNGLTCVVSPATEWGYPTGDPERTNVTVSGVDFINNIPWDTEHSYLWSAYTPPFQYIYTLDVYGLGPPDLGEYVTSGGVDRSYNGMLYHPQGLTITAPFGEQMIAYVNCLKFSGYTVLKSAVHGITSTDSPMNNQWPDLWTTTTAPDCNFLLHNIYTLNTIGNWILLQCPDGVSQLCIIRTSPTSTEHLYFLWSPGGLFTGGAGEYRPTASDEIQIDGGGEYLSSGVNYFYGFRGERGSEITSRLLVTHSPGALQEQILRLLCFEWFVTDIPAATYSRNVCMMSGFTGYYHYPMRKDSDAGACYTAMPDGKQAWHCSFTGAHYSSDNKGTLDGKYRLDPYQVYKAADGDGLVQFFGHFPDLYWGETKELTAQYKTYTFNGIWKQLGPLVFPTFECAVAQNVSDVEARRLVSRTPGKTAAVDAVKPVFAGVVSAVAVDDNTVRLTWESGSDSVTAEEDLRYEIHFSTQPGAPFDVRDVVTGNG